jgi:TolA-binding protein
MVRGDAVASPLALAQRASLADRVAVLEQRAAGDQGATELVNQITQLRSEVQALRGQIEELQQQLEQAKQGQRSQYLDLDGRLNRLEAPGLPPASSVFSCRRAMRQHAGAASGRICRPRPRRPQPRRSRRWPRTPPTSAAPTRPRSRR